MQAVRIPLGLGNPPTREAPPAYDWIPSCSPALGAAGLLLASHGSSSPSQGEEEEQREVEGGVDAPPHSCSSSGGSDPGQWAVGGAAWGRAPADDAEVGEADGEAGDAELWCEFAPTPPDLLGAFVGAARGETVRGALASLEAGGCHPVGAAPYDRVEWTLAAAYALCARAGLDGDGDVSEELLLTVLWVLEGLGSQYRSGGGGGGGRCMLLLLLLMPREC